MYSTRLLGFSMETIVNETIYSPSKIYASMHTRRNKHYSCFPPEKKGNGSIYKYISLLNLLWCPIRTLLRYSAPAMDPSIPSRPRCSNVPLVIPFLEEQHQSDGKRRKEMWRSESLIYCSNMAYNENRELPWQPSIMLIYHRRRSIGAIGANW